MLNMIKADFYRTVRVKAIYIGIAIMLLMLSASIYMVLPGSIGATLAPADVSYSDEISSDTALDESVENAQEDGIESIQDLRNYMLKIDGLEVDKSIISQNINLYYIFIFFGAVIIASDFSTSAVKNTLSSTIDRRKYFFSKLAFLTICCFVIFLVNNYTAYFGNLIFNGEKVASSLGEVTKSSIMQIPVILALISIINGIAFLTRKTSLFNTVTIAFIMVFQLLMTSFIHIFSIDSKVMKYELQSMMTYIIYQPTAEYMIRSYLICAAIIIIFNTIGYFTFKKSEIK